MQPGTGHEPASPATPNGQAAAPAPIYVTLAPTPPTPTAGRRAAAWLRRLVFKFRAQLAPWAVIAALPPVAYLAGRDRTGPGWVAGVAAAAVLAVWTIARPKLNRPAERRYATLLVIAAAAWTYWTARHSLTGRTLPFPPGHRLRSLTVLITGGPVLSLPWWHHRRLRPAVESDPAQDYRVTSWATDVAAQGRALPGTRLVDVQGDSAETWTAVIDLGRGSAHTHESVTAAVPRVESALGLCRGDVTIEAPPSGLAYHALIQVHTGRTSSVFVDNIYDPQVHAQLTGGCVQVGVYPDGSPALWRLFQPAVRGGRGWVTGSFGGASHGLISGDMRLGKSSSVELLINQFVRTGFVVPWVADPQGGMSLPAWAGPEGQADWAATDMDEIGAQFDAFTAVVGARSRYLAKYRWTDERGRERIGLPSHDPQIVPDMPILAWFIDEFHLALAEKVIDVGRFTSIIKLAGKVGALVVLVTHYPDGKALGGSLDLRAQVKAGNVMAFRNGAFGTGQMVLPPGYPSPGSIRASMPDGSKPQGLALLASPSPGGTRGVVMRTLLDRDPAGNADDAAAGMPALHPVDIGAAGQAYQTWRARRVTGEPPPLPARVPAPGRADQAGMSAGMSAGEPSLPADRSLPAHERVYRLVADSGDRGVKRETLLGTAAMPERTLDTSLSILLNQQRIERRSHGWYRALLYQPAGVTPPQLAAAQTAAGPESATTAVRESED